MIIFLLGAVATIWHYRDVRGKRPPSMAGRIVPRPSQPTESQHETIEQLLERLRAEHERTLRAKVAAPNPIEWYAKCLGIDLKTGEQK